MKKIALISASVLALGAASVAADAGGSSLTASLDFSVSTTETAAYVAPADLRGPRVTNSGIDRTIRLIATDIAPVNSCAEANWPYYPSSCLERTEQAGL